MNKVIAVLGVGPGLGTSMAWKYGREGFSVALVARRPAPLAALVQELAAEGITAKAYPADLKVPAQVSAVLQQIASDLGDIDTVYYGPNAPETFIPAFALSVEEAQDKLNLFLTGLIATVQATLPKMRERKGGTILVGLGGSAAVGLPFMSGPGPALAAARNYLYSLHGEVAAEGVFVGMLTLSAVIRNSGWQQGMADGSIQLDLPPGFVIPEIDPADLAEMLWSMAVDRTTPELVYPLRA